MSIASEDRVSRCIIYDRSFRDQIHVDEVLFIFEQTSGDGASHQSVFLRRVAKEDQEIHELGCSAASTQNERKGKPSPGPSRRYYCGFRTAIVGDIPLEGEGYAIELKLDNEGGQAAHVDVALFVNGTTKSEKNLQRLEAGMALAEAFDRIATPFICAVDENDHYHPLRRDPECLTRGFPNSAMLRGIV